jgi:hypothetical protein
LAGETQCNAKRRVGELNSKCGPEFQAYQDCLGSNANDFRKCRETQAALETAFAAK